MKVEGKLFIFGYLRGTIYDFLKIDDILPKHNHTIHTAHISIIARGKIRVTAGDWVYEASAGDVIDLPANQEHEFIALEDNSRLINIIKHIGPAE